MFPMITEFEMTQNPNQGGQNQQGGLAGLFDNETTAVPSAAALSCRRQ